MERIIEVEGLVFKYGKRFTLAIDRLYFRKGLTLLVGPNGSGKTTLINLITGVLKPLKGKINVLGFDPSNEPEKVIKHVSFCLEDTQFPPHMVLEDLVGYLGDEGYRLAKEIGLNPYLNYKYSSLSSGNRRKFILVACLAKEAGLYLIDEPFSSLDYPSKILVGKLLNRESKRKTIIVSTHEVANLKPRDVIFLVNGQVVRCIRDYRPVFYIELEMEDNVIKKLESIDDLNKYLKDGYRLRKIEWKSLFEELYSGESTECN